MRELETRGSHNGEEGKPKTRHVSNLYETIQARGSGNPISELG
jgi:hypothetical protein